MHGLVLENVSHAFDGRPILHHVSLQVDVGEVLCLLGPSGCGKTTALRLAAGLERLQQGRIILGGEVVAVPGRQLPPEQRRIGMVFQDFALFPHLSVHGNVAFGLRGLTRRDQDERVRAALALTGMADYAQAFPHTLSGGQQQRVALSRALAPRPRLLLLDEPFSGLDTHLRGRLREEALGAVKAAGVAAVMVTHDPEEAMAMADRLAVMEAGRIVQLGSPEDLFFSPANPRVAAFFGEPNRLTGVVAGGRVETPLGTLPAAGWPDGSAVSILIRPEAFIPDAGGFTAIVSDIRPLGRSVSARLRVGPLVLAARLPSHSGMTDGGSLSLILDPQQVLVFPAEAPVR